MSLTLSAKAALGFGLAVLTSAIAYTQLRSVSYGTVDPEIAAIERAVRALNHATPEAAAAAATSLAQAERRLWSEAAFASWRSSQPAGWVINSVGEPETKSAVLQRVALSRPQALKSDWKEVVRMITELQNTPSLVVRSVTLTAPGIPSRNMAHVLIVGHAAFRR
jgi:hypothetical protein